jgi:hypothetical protein
VEETATIMVDATTPDVVMAPVSAMPAGRGQKLGATRHAIAVATATAHWMFQTVPVPEILMVRTATFARKASPGPTATPNVSMAQRLDTRAFATTATAALLATCPARFRMGASSVEVAGSAWINRPPAPVIHWPDLSDRRVNAPMIYATRRKVSCIGVIEPMVNVFAWKGGLVMGAKVVWQVGGARTAALNVSATIEAHAIRTLVPAPVSPLTP